MTKNNLNITPEIWKAISGFPGYEVSNQGRVRSFWQRGVGRRCYLTDMPRRILRPCIITTGYLGVNLFKNGNIFPRMVHRLVLLAFVGQCSSGMEACHNDGNKINNHLFNLRWDTRSNNELDKRKHGKDSRGERHYNAKLTEAQVKQIRTLYSQGSYTYEKLGEIFSVTSRNIDFVVNKQTWKHI